MEVDDRELGDRLRAARLLRGWSHADLADAAHISPSVIADVELARRGPTVEAKAALFAALDSAAQEDPTLTAELEDFRAGQPLRWIEASDLTIWGKTRDGQATLPELINRLIRAEYGLDARLRFPSGDSVAQAGWDGQSLVARESEFVAAGGAGWEIGGGRKPAKSKADEDYANRTVGETAPSSEWLGERAETTYMAVTAHRWSTKDIWSKARRDEQVWKDVRALDADNLAHWIERHPAVGQWLAIRLGKRPPDILTLDEVWETWAGATDTRFTAELSLVGRDREAADVVTWLGGPPSVLRLQADSVEEAAAFLHACISVLPTPYREAFMSRALVPETKAGARRLSDAMTPLILLLNEAESGLASAVARRGHHVFVAIGPEANQASCQRLGQPTRWDLMHALANAGLDFDRAERISSDAGRSLTTLRRLMPPAPGRRPTWALATPPRALVAAMLAGGWNDASEGDRQLLEKLSGLAYGEFARTVTAFLNAVDGPIRKIETAWRLKSPRDIWGLIGPMLTDEDVGCALAAADVAFRELDPAYDMPPEDRWFASVRGEQPKHSPLLKHGLADTSILLCLMAASAPATTRARERTEEMIGLLLKDASGAQWWSLASILPKLAEAAPKVFLDAVRRSAGCEQAPISALFDDDDRRSHIRSRHIELIWALERVGWDPALLRDTVEALALLVQFDRGGRNTARPLEQLGRIFLAWSPQTNASAEERLRVLDGLRRDHPDVAWKVMLQSIPTAGSIMLSGSRAQWRNEASDQREPITHEALDAYVLAISRRLTEDVGLDVDRWTRLLEVMEKLGAEARKGIGKALIGAEPQLADLERRDALRTALRKFLARHREAKGAWWSIPASELGDFRMVHDRLEPADPLWRHAWCFSAGTGGYANWRGDWKAAETAAKATRAAALNEIAQAHGAAGVRSLVDLAGRLDWVAEALLATSETSAWHDELISEGLAADNGTSWALAHDLLVGYLGQHGRAWLEPWFSRCRADARETVRLLLLLPADRVTWERAHRGGPEIDEAYWREVRTFALRCDAGDLEDAVGHLLAAQRAFDAIGLVASRIDDAPSTHLIVDVLTAAISHDESSADEESARLGHHAVAQLFTHLAAARDADKSVRLGLEWAYFEVLKHSEYPALGLRSSLATDPTHFAQLLQLGYLPDPESGASKTTLDERLQAHAHQARRVLDECHPIPGADESGAIDVEELHAWTSTMRAQAQAIGRLDPGDRWLGKTLAYAQRTTGVPWPPSSVAEVLEATDSEVLHDAFVLGALFKRGVTTRMPSDGGRQEQTLAAQYRRDAEALASAYPKTSVLLLRISDGYMDFARREDQQAESYAWSS